MAVDDQQFVAAVFNEPVTLPDGLPDSTVDWTISPGTVVTAVTTPESAGLRGARPTPPPTGRCTRRLNYQPPLGEDAEPTVRYANGANRDAYVDLAGNVLGNTDNNAGPAIDASSPRCRPSPRSTGRRSRGQPALGNAEPDVASRWPTSRPGHLSPSRGGTQDVDGDRP